MLGPEENRTLRAAIDRIVPADDYPSARDAGVMNFLHRLIEEEGLSTLYQACLRALNAEAEMSHTKPFADCTEREQDALLAHIERGETHAPWAADPAEFFRTLAAHTVEGYYSDPGNGGNKDGVAWKMVGYKVTL